jgi:hypothetical protein
MFISIFACRYFVSVDRFLKDECDTTELSANPIPVKTPSSYAEMNKIKISEKDLNKLLNNIDPKKATGPDELCGSRTGIKISYFTSVPYYISDILIVCLLVIQPLIKCSYMYRIFISNNVNFAHM